MIWIYSFMMGIACHNWSFWLQVTSWGSTFGIPQIGSIQRIAQNWPYKVVPEQWCLLVSNLQRTVSISCKALRKFPTANLMGFNLWSYRPTSLTRHHRNPFPYMVVACCFTMGWDSLHNKWLPAMWGPLDS